MLSPLLPVARQSGGGEPRIRACRVGFSTPYLSVAHGVLNGHSGGWVPYHPFNTSVLAHQHPFSSVLTHPLTPVNTPLHPSLPSPLFPCGVLRTPPLLRWVGQHTLSPRPINTSSQHPLSSLLIHPLTLTPPISLFRTTRFYFVFPTLSLPFSSELTGRYIITPSHPPFSPYIPPPTLPLTTHPNPTLSPPLIFLFRFPYPLTLPVSSELTGRPIITPSHTHPYLFISHHPLFQSRASLPDAIGAVTWIAPYAPHHSTFVPIYAR